MIRVAFVASTFVVGGAERVTAEVVARLPRESFESNLYFIRDAGPVGRELMNRGIPGIQCIARHGQARILPRLLTYFRRRPPDVVFCLDHHNAMWWGRWAGILSGAKAMVVASHATGLVGKRRAFGVGDRMLMEFTDRVVALSETHARHLAAHEGVAQSQIAVIENGIDLTRYSRNSEYGTSAAIRTELGIDNETSVVMMVAALRPEKAHEALLDAAAALRRHRVLFLVVGDGARRAELEDRAQEMGIADSVRFMGARADVARLLQVADVAVLPSHDVVETLPLALLEAMASGVPVVASRVGSVPDLIQDRESGLLIGPADAVALAQGIEYILDDAARAEHMAARAEKTVRQRYSADHMVAKYADMFATLAA